jgi:hypothetical protein
MASKKNKVIKIIILSLFLTVPVVSSFVSTLHLVTFFSLGNTLFISILLSILYEVGSISAFVTPFVFKKLNKTLIFTVFGILILMQVFGNIFYSWDFVNNHLLIDGDWLKNFNELILYFTGDPSLSKIILVIAIAAPIPIISLFFLKSTIDYINIDEEESAVKNNVTKKQSTPEQEVEEEYTEKKLHNSSEGTKTSELDTGVLDKINSLVERSEEWYNESKHKDEELSKIKSNIEGLKDVL